MEDAAINGQLHVAVGLAQFLIVDVFAAVSVSGEEIGGAASASEHTLLAIELAAINGQRCHDVRFIAVAIHVAAVLARCGCFLGPQTLAHKAAAAAVDAVDGSGSVTELATIDDNFGACVRRTYLGEVLGDGVVAMIAYQTVFGSGVRSVEHHVLRVVPVRNAIVGRVGVGSVVAISDAVHTARTGSEDAAEDVVILLVVVRQNLEGAAVDGDGADAVEGIVDNHVARMSTTGTATVKLSYDDTLVGVFVLVVYGRRRVERDVGSSHKRIAGHVVRIAPVWQSQLGLGTQCSVDNTSHLAASDDDVDVGIHGTLVVAGKDDTGVIVVDAQPLCAVVHRHHTLLVVVIVPCTVNVDVDGTLYGLLGCAHDAVLLGRCAVFFFSNRLTTSGTDTGIEAGLDADAESLLAMRHGSIIGCDAVRIVERIEATVVVDAAEDVQGVGHGAVDGAVVG